MSKVGPGDSSRGIVPITTRKQESIPHLEFYIFAHSPHFPLQQHNGHMSVRTAQLVNARVQLSGVSSPHRSEKVCPPRGIPEIWF